MGKFLAFQQSSSDGGYPPAAASTRAFTSIISSPRSGTAIISGDRRARSAHRHP